MHVNACEGTQPNVDERLGLGFHELFAYRVENECIMGYHSMNSQMHAVEHTGGTAELFTQSQLRDALEDALLLASPAHIVLLDSQRTIVAVNDVWKRFVADHGNADVTDYGIGMDYLAVCRQVLGLSSEDAHDVEAGLQAVLDGTETHRRIQPVYDSMTSQHYFLFQITQLSDGLRGALVSHIDISNTRPDNSERAQMLAQRPIMLAEVGRRRAEAGAMRAAAAIDAATTALAAERAASARLRALEVVTDTALSHLALKDLLRKLLVRLMVVMNVDNAAMLLLDEDGQTLTLQAARGPEEEQIGEAKIPLGIGFAGQIAASREPLVVDDLSSFNAANPLLKETLHSIAGVPLLVEGRLVGVVHIGSATARHFTQQDVQLLQLAADRIATAVDRARLYAAEKEARTRTEDALARATGSETAAVERAEQLQIILETITDGVAVTDQEGRIIQENRAFRELLAVDRAPGFEEWSSAERCRFLQTRDANNNPLPSEEFPTTRALRGELIQGSSGDIHVVAFDGRELALSVIAAPLRDRTGHIVGAVTVARDTTWRTLLERERQDARASELAMREVTERMDEFIATAAHDLRSPLTVAMGTTALAASRFERLASIALAHGPGLADSINAFRHSLDDISRSVDRLSRMVAVLFDTAQLHSGRLELHLTPCDLGVLLREQVYALRTAQPTRTVLVKLRNNRALHIVADVERIGQVITNYLTNALKYSAEDQAVEVHVTTRKSQVQVSVQDQGPGVPASERDRIWQRFYRIQGTGARSGTDFGLGLGLHICKTIIEQHGGQVGVDSTVGEGSTFWFTLPLVAQEGASPQG